MKQSQKIVRKGDYYQIQISEQTNYPTKTIKKEQSQSQPNLVELINQDLPPFSQARQKYIHQPHSYLKNAQSDQLLHQLQNILSQQISDEDKQEVIKLIRQVQQLKLEPLGQLPQLTDITSTQKETPSYFSQLKTTLNIQNIEKDIVLLQSFQYPDIIKLEHQIQVLLGQKKSIPQTIIQKDDKNKEEIENIFALMNSLKYSQNVQKLIQKIHCNNIQHTQINNFANTISNIEDFHNDFLSQLKQDELLLNKLQQNFKLNIKLVKQSIQKIKNKI